MYPKPEPTFQEAFNEEVVKVIARRALTATPEDAVKFLTSASPKVVLIKTEDGEILWERTHVDNET